MSTFLLKIILYLVTVELSIKVKLIKKVEYLCHLENGMENLPNKCKDTCTKYCNAFAWSKGTVKKYDHDFTGLESAVSNILQSYTMQYIHKTKTVNTQQLISSSPPLSDVY